MKRNTLFSFLTIAALGLLTAGPASAAGTFTWKSDAGSNAFRTGSNWTVSGIAANTYPTALDTVIIQSTTNGNDPEISNAEAFTTLTINSGDLTITGENTVTISGSSHTLNGDLVLQDNDSIVKFTSATVTLNGSSTTGIKGEDDGAEIQIDASTLTSNALIHGRMIVKESAGTSTFKNGGSGIVLANANGVLEFADNLTLEDETGAKWKSLVDGGAILRFRESATGLVGNFFLDECAKIELPDANTTITTSGDLTSDPSGAYSGTVDASSSGSCFNYAGPTSICNSTTSGDCT